MGPTMTNKRSLIMKTLNKTHQLPEKELLEVSSLISRFEIQISRLIPQLKDTA